MWWKGTEAIILNEADVDYFKILSHQKKKPQSGNLVIRKTLKLSTSQIHVWSFTTTVTSSVFIKYCIACNKKVTFPHKFEDHNEMEKLLFTVWIFRILFHSAAWINLNICYTKFYAVTAHNITLTSDHSATRYNKLSVFFQSLLGSEPQLDQSVHLVGSKSPAIRSRLVLFWIPEEWRWILRLWPQLWWGQHDPRPTSQPIYNRIRTITSAHISHGWCKQWLWLSAPCCMWRTEEGTRIHYSS